VKIRSGTGPPEKAFVTVYYNDRWFWIDNRDYRTRSVFTFLRPSRRECQLVCLVGSVAYQTLIPASSRLMIDLPHPAVWQSLPGYTHLAWR
jgi:hypothetical protein